MALTGYMIAPSLISKATLEANASYDIGNWPVQSDMVIGRVWRRPGNTADVVKSTAEIVNSMDGSAGGMGGSEFTFPMMGLTPKMAKYILATFFSSGASYYKDVTVRTFNRETGDWEVYQAKLKRPDPSSEAQPAMGGYNEYLLKFINGVLLA